MSTIERHQPGTPAWVDLMTPDPEKARAFYGALFGWGFVVGPPETGNYTMCQVGGRNAAGMGKMAEGAPFPTCWNVYFAVESVDATCARIREQGGKVVMDPMDVMEEGRMAFCADPTGAHFGLWQPRRHTGASVVDEHGTMTWHEVLTRKAEQARDFYVAVFGLQAQKMEGMTYWMLQKASRTLAGVMQMDERFPAEVPPHWLSYFAVNDADAAAQKAAELGGQVQMPPFDTPYGRIAVMRDPFGAVFAVIKLSPMAQQG